MGNEMKKQMTQEEILDEIDEKKLEPWMPEFKKLNDLYSQLEREAEYFKGEL